MNTYIETLKKRNGDQIAPRTVASAVSLADGRTVEDAIDDASTIHKTQAEWEAEEYIAKEGEIVVYDQDDSYHYSRVKIGDGVTNVADLPFAAIPSIEALDTNRLLNYGEDEYYFSQTLYDKFRGKNRVYVERGHVFDEETGKWRWRGPYPMYTLSYNAEKLSNPWYYKETWYETYYAAHNELSTTYPTVDVFVTACKDGAYSIPAPTDADYPALDSVAQRLGASGNIVVPRTPTETNHAASKDYVDATAYKEVAKVAKNIVTGRQAYKVNNPGTRAVGINKTGGYIAQSFPLTSKQLKADHYIFETDIYLETLNWGGAGLQFSLWASNAAVAWFHLNNDCPCMLSNTLAHAENVTFNLADYAPSADFIHLRLEHHNSETPTITVYINGNKAAEKSFNSGRVGNTSSAQLACTGAYKGRVELSNYALVNTAEANYQVKPSDWSDFSSFPANEGLVTEQTWGTTAATIGDYLAINKSYLEAYTEKEVAELTARIEEQDKEISDLNSYIQNELVNIQNMCKDLVAYEGNLGGSEGLNYEMSTDGTYAMCTGENTTGGTKRIATSYNGVPVTHIGPSAFAKSTSTIYIPTSITNIGAGAFSGASAATIYINDLASYLKITLANNWATSPFTTTSNIYIEKSKSGNLIIPEGITSIPLRAFQGIKATPYIKSLTLPESLTSIGSYAFSALGVEELTIPEKVMTIGAAAFEQSATLKTVIFNGTPTSIATTTFQTSNNITDIYVPWSENDVAGAPWGAVNASIHYNQVISKTGLLYSLSDDETHYICTGMSATADTDIVISSEIKNKPVTAIADNAFKDVTRITSVEIPGSITTIGESAFSGCTSLVNVTIGDGVTTIDNSAFYYCTSLTSVTIPDSVTSISSSAFYYCTRLANITVGEGNTAYLSQDGNLYTKDGTTLVIYAAGKTDASFVIPNTVTSIGKNAFRDCDNLTDVTIPDGVTSIGDSAFYGCNNLTSVTIPDSIISTGNWTFAWCSDLTSATIGGNGATRIASYMFYGCSKLTSVIILGDVRKISSDVFTICNNLTDIYVAWSEGAVFGAPWGAKNATIHYNFTPPTNGLTYELSEDGTYYTCTGIGTATATDIVVGGEIDGIPVTDIAPCAFQDIGYDVSSITLVGIETAGLGCLSDSSIEKIVIKEGCFDVDSNEHLNPWYYASADNTQGYYGSIFNKYENVETHPYLSGLVATEITSTNTTLQELHVYWPEGTSGINAGAPWYLANATIIYESPEALI